MRVVDVCQSYFHGFHDIANYKENDRKITALAILKIISYFTIVIPLVFAAIYGAASLCGRVSKKEALDGNDEAVSQRARQVLGSASPDTTKTQAPSTPIERNRTESQPPSTPDSKVVRAYTGDLTESQKSEIESVMGKSTLKINFKKFPLFAVTIRLEDLFNSKAKVIVNAANTHLGGGGGIDGAIHRKGGSEYKKAHSALQQLHNSNYPSGAATLIGSGSLEKEYRIEGVIVVAGPQGDSDPKKENELYSCYYNSLLVADQAGKESIAFPSISTGLFRFPQKRAAAISLKAIYDFVNENPNTNLKTISIHFLPNESAENLENYNIFK